jgi:hypothetical protein
VTDETPGTELEVREQRPLGMPTQSEFVALTALADTLARSNLIPRGLTGRPGDITVILLTGRELRMAPMQALNKIHVIEGKPTLSAELMLALVLGAGHELDILESTDLRCAVRARRRGSDHVTEYEFTADQARTAGLLNKKGPWQQYPAAMLRARAITIACRASFPDVLMGGVSYAPEELGAEVDPMTGEVVGSVTQELIGEGECRDFYARIDALPDAYKSQLIDEMKERQLVLGRRSGQDVVPLLPARRKDELEGSLAALEQWTNRDKPEGEGGAPGSVGTGDQGGDDSALDAGATAPADPQPSPQSVDDVVVDAEIVPNVDDQPDPPDQPGVTDAEVLPEPVPTGPPADPPPAPAASPVDEQPDTATGNPPGSGSDETGTTPGAEAEALGAASAPPADPNDGPSADHQRRRFAITCKEADVEEDTRHAVIGWLTGDRVHSATEATFGEMARAITLVRLYEKDALRITALDDGRVDVLPMNDTGRAFLESLKS